MTEPPLPELYEGELDGAGLAAYQAALRTSTRVISVRAKSGATGLSVAHTGVDPALADLRRGAIRAVQVRYEYDGVEWSDTLLALPHGVRVLRMQIQQDSGLGQL
jgi:hypothetical protein